jgi:hypothetical protein
MEPDKQRGRKIVFQAYVTWNSFLAKQKLMAFFFQGARSIFQATNTQVCQYFAGNYQKARFICKPQSI